MEISLKYLIFYIQLVCFTFKLNVLFYLLSAPLSQGKDLYLALRIGL